MAFSDRLVVNRRLDALTDALDAAREQHQITNGEVCVFAAILLAGSLQQGGDKLALTDAIGLVLSYCAEPSGAKAKQFLRSLMRHCAVEQ